MGLFSKKKPELQDEALAEVAQMFIALPDDPTPGAELLNASLLDFSVESLKTVDAHLEEIRQQDLTNDQLAKFVLRCGAYVGEVIRRQAPTKKYHWLDFKAASKLSPEVKGFGDCLPTAAILWDGESGFTFPLAKVIKYLDNGEEDSVHFFAKAMMSQSG